LAASAYWDSWGLDQQLQISVGEGVALRLRFQQVLTSFCNRFVALLQARK